MSVSVGRLQRCKVTTLMVFQDCFESWDRTTILTFLVIFWDKTVYLDKTVFALGRSHAGFVVLRKLHLVGGAGGDVEGFWPCLEEGSRRKYECIASPLYWVDTCQLKRNVSEPRARGHLGRREEFYKPCKMGFVVIQFLTWIGIQLNRKWIVIDLRSVADLLVNFRQFW